MADQPVTCLGELSDIVTDCIRDKMTVLINQQMVAQAVLAAIAGTGKVDMRNIDTVMIEEAIEKANVHAYCEDIILEVVTKCLTDAGFTNDSPVVGAAKPVVKKTAKPVAAAAAAPPPLLKPALSMGVTALREQILGLLTPSSQIPYSNRLTGPHSQRPDHQHIVRSYFPAGRLRTSRNHRHLPWRGGLLCSRCACTPAPRP
jgi:hypothetical protein